MGRRQQTTLTYQGAERMLEEEAARYGLDVNLGVSGHKGLLPLISFVLVGLRRGRVTTILGCEGRGIDWKWVTKTKCRRTNREKDGCWDLVEINSVAFGKKLGVDADQTEFQEGSKEDQLNWEESSLIKFSHFLGFSTEGLEEEILSFLGKIRKRKEKIVGKGLLEVSRFERSLRDWSALLTMRGNLRRKALCRVEGTRNYQESKVDLFCIQETKVQVMSEEMVRSLGPGRFLIGRFRNEGDGAIWVFTGVYGPFSREDRECLWEELGAIRGLWEEPWCLGGDFNITLYQAERNRTGRITSAMRRGGGIRRGPSPFKFENMWLKAEGFQRADRVVARDSASGAGILVEEEWNLTEEELPKKEAKESYAKWVSMEEVHWRQLSRELWLREGDRNTGFSTAWPMPIERVNAIINGDEWGQSPGDGFTVAFWQNSWEIVKEDILGGVEDLGDYRPISLLGGLYKLLAKVLANRLKKVIGKVISPDQNAFIKGRQILDGSLIANEGAAYCYLGLPLGAPNRASSVWDGVEERMRRRLALWKRQYLSKGGRITLIKSTLSSIPLYQMSVFRMPKSVAKRIEKLQRDFLWGGANGGSKVHLVRWEANGFGDLRVLRRSFGKKCLRLSMGKRSLGGGQGRQMGCWCWSLEGDSEGVHLVLENMGFKVGKGNRIRFWTDLWCGNNVLSQGFPNLFSMAVHRNVTVEECWDQNVGQGGWNLKLLRDLNDWELGLVGNLLVELRDYSVNLEDDSVFWKKAMFGVDKVPTKIAFFAWEATWGKGPHFG
ncbi:putative ribonuclease H protein [Vitis vinifera]|uniref:Putative ribonuclease H protein n=1 Tax=Vitis vinifera TaxID=29760 RepID=A0A438BXR6_VITVI|nr:putative ribonuclease H protein [Vitis vinifera]